MSILINENTRVAVQGITGTEGAFHARRMIEYGTKVVAGVTPGKGGLVHDGVPVFDSMREAAQETAPDVSVIFVPAPYAADAVMEATEAGIKLVVCPAEGIPVLDTVLARRYLEERKVMLIGPNTPGIISPGKCKVGLMAGYIHRQGSVGVVSRSGTLTYEAVHQLSRKGIGQSTCLGIGGDPVVGLSFVDILQLYEEDPGTKAVVLIGEIGGSMEEKAAEFFRTTMTKPLIAYIAGVTAPPERRMGHAGAIISRNRGGAQEKIRALEDAGVIVVRNPAEIGDIVESALHLR
ncbi:succinate--CoA ligase subunit alpha [Syntrophus aciditrophicus]|uniref:Succinate--CoA ligase [ADP-forming] subunit alpha n=1 Tax=Syntrophus aciditrophicus (strain SB) TaxID=56780 RepID=Q2LW33_SYNAS|nr:succinate--CoA ligase subunit alpha [Syntrophus aciditrophicus]ABC78295.1 succinyl-CoA synthetase alpha chain [Syntrophus aciditrophicus SB]